MGQSPPHETQHAAATGPEMETSGPWHRAATPLGSVTLRMAYHAGSTEAIYQLVAGRGSEVPIMQGTGLLTEGIHAHADTDSGAITLQIYLDNHQKLRYVYELTSATNGQLRYHDGTLAVL